ncbi:MAG: cysteine hydrolase [Anaerolinea sp.]|nr:cysteine hydrolase [Anaerolinea sp.]
MITALLLIDLQKDYFPDGRMELEGSMKAVGEAQKILTHFREKKRPIVHIQHLSVRPGATFFIPGTEGVEIHVQVQPLSGETVFQKAFPNSFRNTALLEHLKKEAINHLVLAGMMTHMCLEATTRAAFDLGFQCTVVHDACATQALAFGGVVVPASQVQAAFLAALGSVYAKIVSAEDYILGLSSEGK